jgi:hypothetical protein
VVVGNSGGYGGWRWQVWRVVIGLKSILLW